MTTTPLTAVPIDRRICRAGAWCLLGGLLGVGQVAVTLAWPHQVTEARFSYPFDSFWFVVAELTYAAQHALLVAGGVAMLWLPTAVLAPGAYVFLVFIPAVNGPDFVGRLAIAGWMLLFAVLGYGLTKVPSSHEEVRDA